MGIQINGNTNNINAGIGSLSIEDLNELDIVGVATASNFKTGSSNLHSTGLTVGNNFLHSTGINVGTGATIHVPSSNVLTLGTNSNERIRIKSDGYVGVNETNPQYPLHVSGATTDPSPDGTGILMGLQHEYAAIHLNAADTKGCLIDFSVPNTDRKGGILYYHSNNPTAGDRDAMLFYTNGQNERLRITSDGKIGIGINNPLKQLHVFKSNEHPVMFERGDTSNTIIELKTNGATRGYWGCSTTANFIVYDNDASDINFIVNQDGRIQIGNGSGVNASAPMELQVSSSSAWGDYPEHITLVDQKAYNAADNGAGIQFGGKYNNAGNATTFGSIHGRKATTGDGNFGGILTFNTREHGNSNFERMRIDSLGRVFINSVGPTTPTADYRSLNLVAHAHSEAGISFSRSHTAMGSGSTGGKSIILMPDGSLSFQTHNVGERMRLDTSGRLVVGGTSAYIGGAALAVMGTSSTPNTYGSFAIGKIGANPTAGTTLANIRLNGGSVGTRRGAEINAVANGNWTDGSSHPTKLTFAVANVNSTSATQRYEINHYGHHVFTNENVFPSSGSPGTNGFKGLTQLGYQHWGHRQYYSGQQNMTQNQTFMLFSNNTAHDDIIFWLNIKGFHANRTFATAHGTIGGYGLSVDFQSATGVYGSFSATNIASGRNALTWTSTSPYGANWWIWGWYSGTSGTGTHTGYSAAQLH